jgi:hypothetical protein
MLHVSLCTCSPACRVLCLPCSPVMQRELMYCMEHPEEISKMASVQRKVRTPHQGSTEGFDQAQLCFVLSRCCRS